LTQTEASSVGRDLDNADRERLLFEIEAFEDSSKLSI